MKIRSSSCFIAKVMLLVGAVWLSSQVQATTCDSSADPIIISSSCSDLVVSDTKSAISLDPGITINGDHGLLIQTVNGNVGTVTINAGSQIIGAVYSGIDNEGTITSLNNSNLIQGVGNGISSFNVMGTINNSSGASIVGNDQGITNFAGAHINLLNNSGTISAANNYGIYNLGTIDGITNNLGGIIQGGLAGILNDSSGVITTLTNNGSIIGSYGIENYGIITTFLNNRSITAGDYYAGIYNNGSIDTLTNNDSITTGINGAGIINTSSGVINTLTNNGSITTDIYGLGIDNYGSINTLINNGPITAGVNGSGIYNSVSGTIATLINNGPITAGVNGGGIVNYGSINALTNNGPITAGDYGSGIANNGSINTLINYGSITTGDTYGYGIYNNVSINTLSNNGSIITGDNGVGIYNDTNGVINTLNNAGTVSANSAAIYNNGTITNLLNSHTISSDNEGITNDSLGVITSLVNSISGSIAGNGDNGIQNNGTITSLVNFGSITGGNNPINNGGVISTLTNAGVIVGQIANNYSGSIGTINNLQGQGNGPLALNGNLPATYNIIINSHNSYGQFQVYGIGSDLMAFGIYGGGIAGVGASTLSKGTYSGVLIGDSGSNDGLTPANLKNTAGNYSGFTWKLVEVDTINSIWDLLVTGASTADTQQSLVNTASALQNTFTLQNTVLANSFSYDCNIFGENDVCVSAGGRNTAVSAANGLNNTSALLIAAYRVMPSVRIGAYADQNLSVNNAGSTVNLGNNTPLIGLFGAWNERLDGTGTEVKVSAAYGQKNTTVTRQVVGTSEAGSGSSQLNSQGAQVTAKYGFGVLESVIVSPYVGVRYTQNNMNGYTEAASSTVTAPLTYSALNTNATTALAGVGAQYKFIPQATAFASVGVETDTNTSNGTYSATGITGLTPVNFNPNPVKTRPTAMLGASYDIDKNQRLGVTGIYRQEAYQATASTTVMATYTVGF